MNPKLSLFPLDTTVDTDGQLILRGHRAADLAARFGTPLYVYDVSTIRHQLDTYRRALSGYGGESHVTYASKAFLCTALAHLMAEEGVGLDVASAGEIFIAQWGGVDPADMHLHGNNKTRLDLETALEASVGRIVIDNKEEMKRLTQLAAGRQQRVKVWLRIKPNVAVETHHRYTVTGQTDSKFGLSIDDARQIAVEIFTARDDSSLQLSGLHIHLGSHFHDAKAVAVALEKLIDLALSLREDFDWKLQELCPGGGWSVRYHPDDPPMPIEPFITDVVKSVEIGCKARQMALPKLIVEPGRSIIAQAGVALYTVGGRKIIPGVRNYVSIDGGLADNPRPAMYQARYTALLANRAAEPERETVAVAGPFCETGDVLIQAVDLPVARPGDILAVPVAGAYQLSMSSNYNAARRPAVVFIDGDEVTPVQRRETFEDLVSRDS